MVGQPFLIHLLPKCISWEPELQWRHDNPLIQNFRYTSSYPIQSRSDEIHMSVYFSNFHVYQYFYRTSFLSASYVGSSQIHGWLACLLVRCWNRHGVVSGTKQPYLICRSVKVLQASEGKTWVMDCSCPCYRASPPCLSHSALQIWKNPLTLFHLFFSFLYYCYFWTHQAFMCIAGSFSIIQLLHLSSFIAATSGID